MSTYQVVVVEPEKESVEKQLSFKEIQEYVGGNVERVHLYDDIYALVNEEGAIKQLTPNRHVILQEKGMLPLLLLGNFVVIKSGEEKFENLNEEELREALYIFRNPSSDATIFI